LEDSTTQPDIAIEARGLTRHYGPVKAVNDVSFRVRRGEIIGFLGPNGAGKSTTMRILCGLLPATGGGAWIQGISVARHPDRIKRRIGYMPEMNPLPADMRVNEYLRYRARLKEIPMRGTRRAIERAMEVCDLHRDKTRRKLIGKLSKGYRQRVGIADAILGKPDVIIMDEPTIGLDPHQVLGIRRLIDDLRGRMTVIISSHILPEIELACNRVIIINRGHIVACGTSEDLRQQFVPENTYRLQIRGELAPLEARLHQVEPRLRIEALGTPDEEGYQTVYLKTPCRPQLGNRCIDRIVNEGDWGLREFACLKPNLEDIFMAATRKSWQSPTPLPRGTARAGGKGPADPADNARHEAREPLASRED